MLEFFPSKMGNNKAKRKKKSMLCDFYILC